MVPRAPEAPFHPSTRHQTMSSSTQPTPSHFNLPGSQSEDFQDDYDRPISPLNMPPGQIDGLDSIKSMWTNTRGRQSPQSDASGHHLHLSGLNSSADIAFAAMQYLPTPLLVLDNLKTAVMANEAMGRLLGCEHVDETEQSHLTGETEVSISDRLRGKTMNQLGIDMLEDGRPVWVTWDSFLESVANDVTGHVDKRDITSAPAGSEHGEGDSTPTVVRAEPKSGRLGQGKEHPVVNDAVVEVIISPHLATKKFTSAKEAASKHVQVKMIITVWELDDERFYSLTFTSPDYSPTSVPSMRGKAKQLRQGSGSTRLSATTGSTPRSRPSSVASSRSSINESPRSSALNSPITAVMSASPFPPLGPPQRHSSMNSTPSSLQKIITMKDYLLDNTNVPILAMWKDESVAVPNKAARRLFHQNEESTRDDSGYDLGNRWNVWNEDFTVKLEPSEYPISVLLRTQTPYASMKVGMHDPDTEEKLVFDVLGETITDETTGEFLAGVITCRDVTSMKNELTEQVEKDEERFQIITDCIPQMIWTTTPTGMHDWFSSRWYEYTGLTEEQSLGLGWELPFHPDDMAATGRRWKHSLATGEPYSTEYRCRSKDGSWRWMLGRALPMRNKQTGEIEKWFGTCTDIHEAVESRFEAKRTRQQLLSVISHAHVTLFAVDRHRNLTLLEGSLIWDRDMSDAGGSEDESCASGRPGQGDKYIGRNVYDVFMRANPAFPRGDIPPSLAAIEDILAGQMMEEVREFCIDGRWYRTRYVPVLGKKDLGGAINDAFIDGVIAVSMDVTEQKSREAELHMQEQENTRLLANEAAAKEASRLKSQFLANMSHEIRTPIAGVIGMAELLADMNLDEEQRDCAENIQRSANGLLTVINDILDFSKVESGRLDIEEVQFSLSVVVKDVSKMLGFAAERKNLNFESDVSVGTDKDLIVMGDPGRVRQIITNLLTNSIKFTTDGQVKFSVVKERETADIFEVKFIVEDTGIGIEEEVRKRLFQPFSQADSSTARRFGGTGLGLTISKNLVDLMKGRITLESTLGQGTTATFWIPFNKPQYHDGNSQLIDLDSLPDRLQSEMSVSCNSSEYDHVSGTPPKILLDGGDGRSKRNSSVMTPPSQAEPDVPMSERAKVEVLVVEDNAINQQIAIKTIRKLGFKVTAVWNGKEALDYLLAAQSPESQQKKPDIILMDVQMPVIDGYRATHMLRHHAPYSMVSRHIPIVAMTASAIQGDREKCEKAGMDDYLSKPVKGKTLEKMLLKWAWQTRALDVTHSSPRKHSKESQRQDSEHGSDCEELGEYRILDKDTGGLAIKPLNPRSKLASSIGVRSSSVESSRSRPKLTTRTNSHTLNLPGIESEGDRAVLRSQAEEKAVALRDDKLIVAAGGLDGGAIPHLPENKEGQKLTVANMEIHERGGDGLGKSWSGKQKNLSVATSSSGELNLDGQGEAADSPRSMTVEDEQGGTPKRPKVGRRWRDSEQTITSLQED